MGKRTTVAELADRLDEYMEGLGVDIGALSARVARLETSSLERRAQEQEGDAETPYFSDIPQGATARDPEWDESVDRTREAFGVESKEGDWDSTETKDGYRVDGSDTTDTEPSRVEFHAELPGGGRAVVTIETHGEDEDLWSDVCEHTAQIERMFADVRKRTLEAFPLPPRYSLARPFRSGYMRAL